MGADIRLDPLSYADADPLHELLQDPAIGRFLGAGSTRSKFDQGLRREVERFQQTGWGLFAIRQAKTGTLVGYAGFIPCAAQGCDGPELICAIREDQRRSGVGTRACREAIAWGIHTHRWQRIFACVAEDNRDVFHFVELLGFRRVTERKDVFDGTQTVFALEQPPSNTVTP